MIRLTITVANIADVMALYTHIRLYTSSTSGGTYTHLAYVTLVAGVTTYVYDHNDGTLDTWYKSSYYNTNTSVESNLSDPVQGEKGELFYSPTYPPEFTFDTSEQTIIKKIRRFIGDIKGLKRLYIDEAEFCSYVIDDDKTVNLSEKSWPVYISVNGTEKTSLVEPVVQGYQYLTFSGTLDESTDVLDIWYYTFKFSDREIYESYNDAQMPPWVTSSTVNRDMIILQASIDLLEHMTAEDMVEDGAIIGDDGTLYNPSPGLSARNGMIKRLRKQLDNLVKQHMFSNLTGIQLD